MPTNRRVRRADAAKKWNVTAEAVGLFQLMCALPDCTCVWGEKYWEKGPDCVSCDQWSDLHNQLHRELRLMPYEWPVFWHAPDNHPVHWARYHSRSHPGGPAHWKGAQRLFEELDQS
jgi:hypothetical protein